MDTPQVLEVAHKALPFPLILCLLSSVLQSSPLRYFSARGHIALPPPIQECMESLFLMVTLTGRCYWHLVGWGQGGQPSHSAQESHTVKNCPAQKVNAAINPAISPQMSPNPLFPLPRVFICLFRNNQAQSPQVPCIWLTNQTALGLQCQCVLSSRDHYCTTREAGQPPERGASSDRGPGPVEENGGEVLQGGLYCG